MNKPSLENVNSINFSVIENAIDTENICNLYKTDSDNTVLEIKVRMISTGKLVHIDFMKVIGNQIIWHANGLREINPIFSPTARLQIEKILRNRAFL